MPQSGSLVSFSWTKKGRVRDPADDISVHQRNPNATLFPFAFSLFVVSVPTTSHLIPDRRAASADGGADERTLLSTNGRANARPDTRGRSDDDRALLHRARLPHRPLVPIHVLPCGNRTRDRRWSGRTNQLRVFQPSSRDRNLGGDRLRSADRSIRDRSHSWQRRCWLSDRRLCDHRLLRGDAFNLGYRHAVDDRWPDHRALVRFAAYDDRRRGRRSHRRLCGDAREIAPAAASKREDQRARSNHCAKAASPRRFPIHGTHSTPPVIPWPPWFQGRCQVQDLRTLIISAVFPEEP
jgi:hypothetical protein